ncbi:MAG: hypothetical protein AB7S92_06345 [Parvibaculaceae bacterium]
MDPGPFETTHFLRDLDLAARKAERSNKPVRMTVVIDPRQPQPRIAVASAAPESFNTSEAALQAARKRGAERIADILGGEDMLSADAFADEIGATRETVNNKRKRHEILGLEGPKRGIRFPKWQLSRSGELLPGLPELFEALGGHPWSVYRFLLAEHPEFDGKRGLDALRSGPAAEIIAVARSIRSGTFS